MLAEIVERRIYTYQCVQCGHELQSITRRLHTVCKCSPFGFYELQNVRSVPLPGAHPYATDRGTA